MFAVQVFVLGRVLTMRVQEECLKSRMSLLVMKTEIGFRHWFGGCNVRGEELRWNDSTQ